uniref:Uncharacterized protein n=1 Tax=Gasterosteus aculeatus aculeatus TaxID=481459 RepID=A0AAQ4RHM5_GASAC
MKDADVTLPEAKADVKLPDVELKETSAEVEIKAPQIKIRTKADGSPSKFKMPTVKLPKFGVETPRATIEALDLDGDINIDGADIKSPENVLAVDVAAPSIDIEDPSIELGGKGSKFKLPSFGFSGPQIKQPGIDLSLSKKDVDVTLPEAKADVKLPDVELKETSAEVEIKAPEIKIGKKGGSPSKFKMPTFKLPKFGVGTPHATIEAPDLDEDIKIPEEVLVVGVAAPSVEIEDPSIELDGKGSKFKLPSLSFSGPQIKRPEIDLSLSKKNVDVTLPDPHTDAKLPDVELKETSAEVEMNAPGIKIGTRGTDESPSKYKMPTFKLPKFGFGSPSADIEVPEKDIKIDGADFQVPEEVLAVDIAAPSIDIKEPSIDIKTTGTEPEGKGRKFKLPSLTFSGPQIKRSDINTSLSRKDVDMTQPSAEIKLTGFKLKESSPEVEIKAPGIDVQTSNVQGSPAKLKMPIFTLPKFGAPCVSVEVPDVDKDIKVDGGNLKLPEVKAEVIPHDVENKEPVGSISVLEAGMIEGDAQSKKTSWTMPKFSFSKTSVKAPEADVNLDAPKVDVTLPAAKMEVHLPDIDIKESSGISVEGGPATELDSKLRSKFTLPKFSFSKQSAKESKFDVSLPVTDVEVKQTEVELSPPEGDVELERQESKFKMPKFGISMPKVKGPVIDLSLLKKDVDVTLPEAKAEAQLPDARIKHASATMEIKTPEIEAPTGKVEGSPSKLKMPTFTMPRFGAATPKVSVDVPDVDETIKIDQAAVEVAAPSIDTEGLSLDLKAKGSELGGSGSKFKMPKFGISMPKVKGPEIDLNLLKKDVDLKLPEAEAEVQLPDVKIKQPSATVEIKAPESEAPTGNVEGSPSKLKMPTFTLPKFRGSTSKVSVDVPDADKKIKIGGATVETTAPGIDGLSVDVKAEGSEVGGSGSKFKMPKFGMSMTKVKGPEIDLSLLKKDVDVTLPEEKAEVKLPSVGVKEPEAFISEIPDSPTVEVETKMKRSNWTFPTFSFSKTGGKITDEDVDLEKPKVDVTSTGAEADVPQPSGEILMEEPSVAEPDSNLKKTKFSLPRFSFSKSSVKAPEVSAELPRVDISLPEGQVIVKQPEMQIKAPEIEAELEGQERKFKFPKFGIALPKAKGPGEELKTSQEDAVISLPEIKAEVKFPQTEVKEPSAAGEIKASETEVKSKDVGGSPMKFKLPAFKMPKFGAAPYDVNVEAPDADKVAETDVAKLKEDVTVDIKGLSADIKSDQIHPAAITDSETPKTETDAVGLGSPSKFKLPSFKMTKLSFSRTNPEDEPIPVHIENKDQQEMKVEPKEERKSPKVTFSLSEILKNMDVEFDVLKTSEDLETSKEVHEIDESSGKQEEAKGKEAKQDTAKSPEKTGWFKFPKFGLSSPSEPAKTSIGDKFTDKMSPEGETLDEEISPTSSVQSSDAFADISSAMTSERVGLSSSSPTKVTVKYSDPNTAAGLRETYGNIITSTARAELISVEPNLPEKITILSSGVSSSSEDTLRLETRNIHVITSNTQATPEAQHAKLLTAVQIQSAGGLPRGPGADEAAPRAIEASHSGKKTVFERHFVTETSSERSESNETIVITKQITRRFDSSEPISGETASSIQRLRDSVHSDKMRFFDGADE